jgi:glycosyltransferase involved in cell wall biosynthesis
MNIAINTRVLNGNEVAAMLLNKKFEQLALLHTEHNFIFISANEEFNTKNAIKNIQTISLKQSSKNPLLWKYWYNFTLNALLKKIKADVVVHTDIICCLRTKLPQWIVVNDLAFTDFPSVYPKKYNQFLEANAGAFLTKANNTLAASAYLQEQIIQRYSITEKNITVFYPAANEKYQPINWEQREQVKTTYAAGKEYFLFSGIIHAQSNLINLLKAFSLFKKWQKSNMQLILAINTTTDTTTFIKSLQTYKHKADVILLKDTTEDELRGITGAAYAFVTPVLFHDNMAILLNALQCGVPVISGNTLPIKEILGEAVLYADCTNVKELADKMMLLFKDEDIRRTFINKGLQQVKQYKGDSAVNLLWKNILATIQPV